MSQFNYMIPCKSTLHIDVHWTSNRRLIPTGLDSGRMIWTLLLWTSGSIGFRHWDSGRLDAWLLDAWTLGLWATGHLDTGHLDFGRLKSRRWDSVRLDASSLEDWTFGLWTLGLWWHLFLSSCYIYLGIM